MKFAQRIGTTDAADEWQLFVDDLLAARRFRLFRTALAWSGSRDRADDLVQNTLIKAASNWHTLRDPAKLDAWLFSILTNCWRMHLRSQRKFESLADVPEDFLIDERTPELIHEAREVVDRIRLAVASLPVLHREVVTLVDLEEFSYLEVARILDVPAGTVMSRLARGRQPLRIVIEQHSRSAQGSSGNTTKSIEGAKS